MEVTAHSEPYPCGFAMTANADTIGIINTKSKTLHFLINMVGFHRNCYLPELCAFN